MNRGNQHQTRKEKEVADFTKSALPLAQKDTETVSWYVLQIGQSTFGIFDTFRNRRRKKGAFRQTDRCHVDAKVSEPPAKDSVIEQVELLAVK